MNIFEFLCLPEDHRTHPFQLVKHRAEVPDSKLTLPVYGQVKRDGIFAAVVVFTEGVFTDRVGIFGRTGKKLTNVEHLEARYQNFPTGIYLGELQTEHEAYLEKLSGVVNPNRVEPLDEQGEKIKQGLYIDFFDMLTLNAFIDGETPVTFIKRHSALERRIDFHLNKPDAILPITELNSEEEIEAFANNYVDEGQEGAVFKLDCDYSSGHKGYRQTKIVRMVSYDLTCIGFEEGKGKYKGKVANLMFKWKGGRTITAMLGKGWSHADAEAMFHDIKNGGKMNVIGKIFAVKALQESSKGVLRLPKVSELRHDKEIPDFY